MMKAARFVVAVAALIGALTYWRTRPIVVSDDQFANFIDSTMPRTTVSGFGSFYFNNGSWWQETPTLSTPDGKPITLLFDSSDAHALAEPTKDQIKLAHLSRKTVLSKWDVMEKDFSAYFAEMDDPAKWEETTEWEISVDGASDPQGWSISAKVPGGDAAWYTKDFQGDEGSSVHAAY